MRVLCGCAVLKAGFSAPSAIQSQCWPIALQGKDCIAIAKTGSGKTVGFLLPLFLHIEKTVGKPIPPGAGPVGLVIAPTRELAIQIAEETSKFGKSSGITSVCVYGGVPKGQQMGQVMRGVHVIVCTPGRMNDFLTMKSFRTGAPPTNLNRCTYLVLDEADRMLDMGFEPQIRQILDMMGEHQTLMFSATWPKEVQQLAREFLKTPTQVNIGETGKLNVNKDVTQIVHKCSGSEKEDKLVELLTGLPADASIIIFCNKKRDCEYIAQGVNTAGIWAESIHGDKDQWERQKSLQNFTLGKAKCIVATDVAARGLDIKGVSHVINYDFPMPSKQGHGATEDWVHRVGRTGRAGMKGIAHTLFDTTIDRKSAGELVQVLKGGDAEIPDWLEALGSRFGGRGGGRGGGFGGGSFGGWIATAAEITEL